MNETVTHEDVIDLLCGPPTLLQSRAAELARTALALYEIMGRTVPPTDAEIEAHAAAGGRWWVIAEWGRNNVNHVRSGSWVQPWAMQIARLLREQENTRWWAHDASGAPCAWPVVSEKGDDE